MVRQNVAVKSKKCFFVEQEALCDSVVMVKLLIFIRLTTERNYLIQLYGWNFPYTRQNSNCKIHSRHRGRQINYKKNKLNERAVRIVCTDTVTSFENFLIQDKSFTIHYQNIQSLVIEISKVINNLPGGTFCKK